MTGTTGGPRVPGTTLLKIARLLLNEHLLSTVVQPTISDLQREIASAGPRRLKRLRAQWGGYCAFWTVMLVAPFRPGHHRQRVPALARFQMPSRASRSARSSSPCSFSSVPCRAPGSRS